jgi:hypothetical protein
MQAHLVPCPVRSSGLQHEAAHSDTAPGLQQCRLLHLGLPHSHCQAQAQQWLCPASNDTALCLLTLLHITVFCMYAVSYDDWILYTRASLPW